mmetsp:Transcript_34991/g.53662  ORF Transcript_34991/g.53662 Transcript_34991/m.53662 type:complete len:102 (+) Transcript_34991:131-436(+)|eukprot:CAMPEP_0118676028 /NCGR_PEP_ID=MMETSP0800-20121206/1803_1 /TAXON_ID=210618 ORGANISM="Striatella unipunctata, Strain CCMP2910" /NCGR_SAMPLE_ID=MMETSP0800 /ASSEMBLY_ACC=CAM_ASM_000638 /LENGTH=101 /DNA_ID=CAMNT_0006571463 /DNA_START=128 /DNA_END=433 /DNA_ORIENTATION=-
MCNDVGEGSRCCLGYSVVGIIFTLFCGAILSSQPFFLSGIEDAEQAQGSAFGATGMFFFTFVLSLVGIWYDGQQKAQEVDTGDGYQLNNMVPPAYGSSRYD